jgi:hypothetical protein
MIRGLEVIPTETKTLLQTGKVSVKRMPQTKYLELYQDYICGCVLRIANETFALLPFKTVIVTAVSDILNTNTGHLEAMPVLSAVIPRATLARLNLQAIDPSDSMRNFVHQMDFKKTRGFMVIERIEPSALRGQPPT